MKIEHTVRLLKNGKARCTCRERFATHDAGEAHAWAHQGTLEMAPR